MDLQSSWMGDFCYLATRVGEECVEIAKRQVYVERAGQAVSVIATSCIGCEPGHVFWRGWNVQCPVPTMTSRRVVWACVICATITQTPLFSDTPLPSAGV